MGKAYSVDLREKVIAFVKENGNKTKAAKLFGIHRDTINNWCNKLKTGDIHPAKRGPRNTKKVNREELISWLENNKDKTLEEIGKQFGVSYVAIWKILRQLGYRHKKNVSLYRKK